MKKYYLLRGLVLSVVVLYVSASPAQSNEDLALKNLTDEQALVMERIRTFDELDFEIFSNQKWGRVKESHSDDILVHWPDGRTTKGLEEHISDLQAMFIWGPDIQIREHPIKFGSGDWTAVMGTMTGTFSRPMPVGGGKYIEPTGKSFSINMVTLGYWKGGVMVEEYLFWDNQAFMKQIGLGQ